MGPETSYPIALIIGYLLGSIPCGLVLTKLAGTQDLRSIGSGNIGATNVLRTGRKGLAAATLLLDALKGTAAVLIGASIRRPGPRRVVAAARRLSRPYLSGLAQVQRRQGRRNLSRRPLCAELADRPPLLRGLAVRCGDLALFLAFGADRLGRFPPRPLRFRPWRGGAGSGVDDGAAVVEA